MHPIFKIIFYLYMIVLTVLLLLPLPAGDGPIMNDKVAHAVIFFLMSLLIVRAYPQVNFFWTLVPLMVVYGALIELLQGWSGYRHFSLPDLAADIFGIFLYAVTAPLRKGFSSK